MADERHDVAFIVGAVLGGLGGAIATLFTAPQAGQRTRSQLAGHANAVGQRLSAGSSALQIRGQELTERATGAISSVTGRYEATIPVSPVATSNAGESVFTLPDPLEPDPVIEPGADLADIAPVALASSVTDPTAAELEHRPAASGDPADHDSRGSGL